MQLFTRLAAVSLLTAVVSLAACQAADQTSPSAANSADRRGGTNPADTGRRHDDSTHHDSTEHRGGDSTSHHDTTATGGETRVRVSLAPAADFPGASGKAEFEVRLGKRKLEIEVEHILSLKGDTVTFTFAGAAIGKGVVDTLGEAELELESEHGATVPDSVAGKAVSVTTSTGAVIVSGSF